ncbi:MAG: hypothetical protein ACR2OW_11005, partial [Methyloligellaceae bacterium]
MDLIDLCFGIGMPRSNKIKNLSNPALNQRYDFCHLGPLFTALLAIQIVLISTVSGKAESLFDALSSAYEFNPALQAERARQNADREQIRQAHAGWQP